MDPQAWDAVVCNLQRAVAGLVCPSLGDDDWRGAPDFALGRLDRTNPRGGHISDLTLISFDAAILTHDFICDRHVDTFDGSHCLIGTRTVIMPGVRIGNHCVIGSGVVVIADIPDNCLAVGNPGRVMRENIVTGHCGICNPHFVALEGIAVPPGDEGSFTS